jgi:hypothetical protein
MAGIFISYRRQDAWGQAEALYTRLCAWFTDAHVFMDNKDIQPGEDWRQRLGEELDRADVVLVVISPGWYEDRQTGAPRLGDDDIMRWEIEQALQRRKRVIPVVLDGAAVVPPGGLPPSLEHLPRLQYVPLSHQRFEKDIETLIEAVEGKGRFADRLREVGHRIRLAKGSLAVVPTVAVACFAAAWVSLFDLVGLDTRTATVLMVLGDRLLETAAAPDLVAITVPSEATASVESRRRQFARLITALADRGAARIVFDVFFRRRSAADAELLEAVRAARARGIELMFGFNDFADDVPVTLPGMREADSPLGNVCVGKRLGYATFAVVALSRGTHRYPSLPLLFALGPVTIETIRPDLREVTVRDARGQLSAVKFSVEETVRVRDRRCPALQPGDRLALLLFPLPARDARGGDRYTADDVLGTGAPDLRGKHVMVGIEDPLDQLRTRLSPWGAAQFGFQFQVDAASAIRQDLAVRPLGFWAQWVLMLLMAAVAALCRLRLVGASRFVRTAVLVAVLVAYLAVALIVYVKLRILLNVVYQVTAFVLSSWLFTVLERRWSHARA